jgi:hypothetical protein
MRGAEWGRLLAGSTSAMAGAGGLPPRRLVPAGPQVQVHPAALPLALHVFADNSRHSSPWAAKLYADARARGKRHPRPSASSDAPGCGSPGPAGTPTPPPTQSATAANNASSADDLTQGLKRRPRAPNPGRRARRIATLASCTTSPASGRTSSGSPPFGPSGGKSRHLPPRGACT